MARYRIIRFDRADDIGMLRRDIMTLPAVRLQIVQLISVEMRPVSQHPMSFPHAHPGGAVISSSALFTHAEFISAVAPPINARRDN